MKYYNIKEIENIPKTENSEIVIRNETNELHEHVVDMRIRAIQQDGDWSFTRWGITYPAKLLDQTIEGLIKAREELRKEGIL